MRTKILLIFLSIQFSNSAFPLEVRQGKAVYEISPEKGLKITSIAQKNIDMSIQKISSVKNIVIPVSAIVRYQQNIGIYRLRDDWFKLVSVKMVLKNKSEVQIWGDLKDGDSVVVSGVDLLRVAEIDAFGGEE